MFTRELRLPKRSFFLLGPRGTGKTTWLRQVLPKAHTYNLLLEREVVRLLREPELFRREVEALPRGSWIVVDEVQKLPSLLDDVHDLLSTSPSRYRFALTGSSARKLRGANANLLAGRVISRTMHPLTWRELGGSKAVEALLRFGALPLVCTEPSVQGRVDLLDAYVETYLTQEIRAEALARNLAGFTRFLEVAALANGQVASVAAVARDAGVARPTVQGFFEVLVDTLLGVWLPAWRPKAKIKEVSHPKFYFFDTGVVRALGGRVRDAIDPSERGPLLETLVLHELRAQIAHSGVGGQLSYWRTPSGSEVDFIWTRGNNHVAIEVKAKDRWRKEETRALRELGEAGHVQSCFGVYLGERPLRDGPVHVLPFNNFLTELNAGRVLRVPPRRTAQQ